MECVSREILAVVGERIVGYDPDHKHLHRILIPFHGVGEGVN